jgi:hypothetical protein
MISVLAIAVAAGVSFGADIYVSPGGNDAAAGTLAAPFASLARARDKADTLKSSGPVTVYLRGGTYYLSTPVVFGPANSGSAAAPIVYTAYGSEKPVISGGIKLTNPTWTTSSGSIMKTTIATNLKVDQLFLNGKRQVLARYPNFTESQPQLQGYASGALTRAAACANPAEGPGYIRALHDQLWGGNDFIITGKSGTTVTYNWVGDNQRGNAMHATFRMVENIYELLDTAGEWFYRKSTGELFFWPPSGTNLSTATIELASQDELIHIAGTSMSAKVNYLSFKGLTFTQTYRTMFSSSKTYEPLSMGDWCIMRTGTVFMQNAENICVECCTFDQVGGNGIFMSGYNRRHVIFNNDFEDGGASCVAMCGLQSSIRCGCTWSSSVSCSDNTAGPLTEEYPAFILIDNNMMHNFGRFEKQVAGVEIAASRCDTVRHNTIYHCPRAGINVNDGYWGGHMIDYNKVYEVVLETSDHGPFNSWGRCRNWGCGSNWNNVPTLAQSQLDPITPTIIRNNYFKNSDTNFFGIDLDDGSTNYSCHNNLVIGGGFKLQRGRFNHCVNNILIKGGTIDIHDPMPQCGDSVRHNIIVGYEFADWCCSWATAPMNQTGQAMSAGLVSRGALVDSNCYWGYGITPRVFNWTGTDRTGTACTWAQWVAGGNDVHSIVADPLFVDPANENYQVKSGSPAFALGFKNFPMDSFGVMAAACGTTVGILTNRIIEPVRAHGAIRYSTGRLIVSNADNYRVTIMTASGKVVGSFSAKGDASFAFSPGAGMYLVNLTTKKGFETRRFVIY